jgi:flagellar hook-basal body complex protein FliE
MIPLVGPIGTKLIEGAGDAAGAFLGNVAQPSTGIGASFASMVGEAATKVADNLEKAEQLSIQALQGEADTRAVVDAVMTAEQSLQAAIAVRDKIVSAYLEISRMAI